MTCIHLAHYKLQSSDAIDISAFITATVINVIINNIIIMTISFLLSRGFFFFLKHIDFKI